MRYLVIYETSKSNSWGKRVPVRQAVLVEDENNEMPFGYEPEQLQEHDVDEIIAIISFTSDTTVPMLVIEDREISFDAAGGMIGRYDPDADEED